MVKTCAAAAFLMGLASLVAAQPTLLMPTTQDVSNLQTSQYDGLSGPTTGPAIVDPLTGHMQDAEIPSPGPDTMPMVDSSLGSGVSLQASGGDGCWNFDYNYLGCNTGTWSGCTSPVGDRYSPESNGYLKSQGGQITVRLWYPMANTNFDLYIEKYNGRAWEVVYTGQTQSSWQKRAVFQTNPGESYRFRAYRRSGAGYYTMSWKYDNSGPALM